MPNLKHYLKPGLKMPRCRSIPIIQIRGRVGSTLYMKINGYHNCIMIFTLIMKRGITPNLQQITNINTSGIKTRTHEKTTNLR